MEPAPVKYLSSRNGWTVRWRCWAYALGWLAVVAVAGALRLPGLDRRPMHPDEANQAWKTGLLWQTGLYRYDPAEHHGPTLYYLTLPVLWLAGPADFAQTTETHYRLVPALAGLGLVAAVLLLRNVLGDGPVLWAAGLTALSPVMVFYSRYYIQEMLLVLFTLGVLGSVPRWRQASSPTGAVVWAAICGGLVGLMAATKETWTLALAAMAAAGLLAAVWNRGIGRAGSRPCPTGSPRPVDPRGRGAIRPPSSDPAGQEPSGLPPLAPCSASHPAGGKHWVWPIVCALVAFLGVTILFYTYLGVHPEGLWDAFGSYRVYLQRGVEAGPHRHPPLFYLERLLGYRAKGVFWSEGVIVLLAAIGLLDAFGRSRSDGLPIHRSEPHLAGHCSAHSDADGQSFVRFLAFYTVILTGLYSAIPYKTPWCAIQFWQGWILLAGWGGGRWASWTLALSHRRLGRLAMAPVGIALLLGLGHLAWQSEQLNFNPRLYADGQRNPWVYAHTATHILRLAERMEELAAVVPEGHRMTVHVVVADNYWPLPWYLRRFDSDRVGYWASADEWTKVHNRLPPPHVLIVQAELGDQIEPLLPAQYNGQMLFRLRPEVFLRVYVRQDVWEAFLHSVGSTGQ
jgi:uncharacterized protein (TIGR03663 family)